MTPTPKGSADSRRLALRYVLKHPVAFREYFVPRVRKQRYWHRFTFTPILLGIDQGDSIVAAGRAVGKSFTILEPELVRHAISHPGEESMITALRKLHVTDRMERVIDYFEHPFLKLFLKHAARAPSYTVETRFGHMLYGISVGDDPEARMVQGKHVGLMALEEAHQYPLRGWIKLQGAKHAAGCRVLMIGVPDGRIDTPFKMADSTYESFKSRRFHLSRRTDPYFNQKSKTDMAGVLGGENSDRFMQEIDAEWGSPSWSAWNIDAILKCMRKGIAKVHVTVSGRDIKAYQLTPTVAMADFPGSDSKGGEVIVAADIGYSQPSECAAFQSIQGEWHMIARLSLIDRMEHDDQASMIAEFARRYNAAAIGIDATEGEGRAICTELEKTHNIKAAIHRVSFVDQYLTGWVTNQETGEQEEEWEAAKLLSTRLLREMFGRQELQLPQDDSIIGDFNKEVEYRSPQTGKVLVKTPEDVHVTDMCRVFAIVLFLAHPPTLEDDGSGFSLPEIGEPDYRRMNPVDVIA